jgi:hypothetical protein
MTTGIGTQNEINWTIAGPPVPMTPGSAPSIPTALPVTPTLSSLLVAGTLALEWWLDPTNGLSIQNVTFTETSPAWKPGAVHTLAQYLQWCNLRLIFDGTAAPVPFTDPKSWIEVGMINGVGTRKSDSKQFGFALTLHLICTVDDPRAVGVSYTVDIQYAYLFGMPKSDQEPSHSAHAIKVFPTLTVTLNVKGTVPGTLPDIAADLKMIHAPGVTRNADPVTDHSGQRLPDPSYKPTKPTAGVFWDKGGVVSFLACDTNDPSRKEPGAGTIVPNPPDWDYVFDYLVPGIRQEMLIDAVVYPRGLRGTRPSFTIPWATAETNPLMCYREPGQGEYDNIHITPYLGFDDPNTDDPSAPTAMSIFPWIEAPLAADEVIHLHWRWGSAIPTQAAHNNTDPKGFEGWQDQPAAPGSSPPLPNQIAGAPLIPPNQSLRIKVTCNNATGDNTNDPSSAPAAITKDAVVVWYMATAHQPAIGTPVQFFGQGFGLAMYMETIGKGRVLSLNNWELLVHNTFLGQTVPNYHDFRWNPTGGGKQRIPFVQFGEPAISRNQLSIPGAPKISGPVLPKVGP